VLSSHSRKTNGDFVYKYTMKTRWRFKFPIKHSREVLNWDCICSPESVCSYSRSSLVIQTVLPAEEKSTAVDV